MPRYQAQERAVRRLTKRICDLLFDPQFINVLLRLRKELGINIKDLKKQANEVLKEKVFTRDRVKYVSSTDVMYARNKALAQHLLKHRLIGRSSYRALERFTFVGDDGKFWQKIEEAGTKKVDSTIVKRNSSCRMSTPCHPLTS